MGTSRLAVNGGRPVRDTPFPPRRVFGPDDQAAVDDLFRRSFDTGKDFRYGGDVQRAYEADFAAFHGAGRAVLVSSGTAALYTALGALGLGRPGEVVVPAITDAGGVMPVPLSNLWPVVADTEPSSFNVGPSQIEEAITDATRAVVVAHIGGEPADIAPIVEVARRHRLPLIEDCSQAHGAVYRGQMVGTFGDIAVYSTMTNKHHCTGGQGGIVLARSADLHERVRLFSDRGKLLQADGVDHVTAALNFNGSDLSAAIGRAQLRKLPGRITARRAIATSLAAETGDLLAAHVIAGGAGTDPSYWFVRIRLDLDRLGVTRDFYAHALRSEGIPCGSWAEIPAKQPWFKEALDTWPLNTYRASRRHEGPLHRNAEEAAASHITIFAHERWTVREVEDTGTALRKLETELLSSKESREKHGADRRA